MKYYIKLYLILLIIPIFLSCNLFFSTPHGRENINDDAAQITGFTAVPSSDTSVVTLWNWKDTPSWINDDKINEIKIQHSIMGYPENLSLFIGESFSDKSIWQHEWKNLTPNITHYFSLFAKSTDNDGHDTWFAPIKAKVKLPGTAASGVIFSRTDSLNIDSAGSPQWLSDPDNVLEISLGKWAVVFFDIPEGTYISSARMILAGPSVTDFRFAPLDGVLPEDDMEKFNRLQDGLIVNYEAERIFAADPPVPGDFELTEVVRAASMSTQNAILIRTISGGTYNFDNAASAPYIIADIIK